MSTVLGPLFHLEVAVADDAWHAFNFDNRATVISINVQAVHANRRMGFRSTTAPM